MRRYLTTALLLAIFLCNNATVEAAENMEPSTIQAALAPLRAKPSSDALVIKHLEIGKKVMVLRHHGDWAKVIVVASGGNAETGWLRESVLKETEPVSNESESIIPRYQLKISGTGTRQDYRARCKWLTSFGERKRGIFRGKIPSTINFVSPEVSCFVDVLEQQHTNGFTAALYEKGHGQPIAKASAKGFGNCAIVASKGYWGGVVAQECTSRLLVCRSGVSICRLATP